MKIKSLLLGSAAAMLAVSGASAADAIIAAEPEPVEYVRVCDAFGAGYFYIPGTETCLKISGYVRMRVLAEDNQAVLNPGGGRFNPVTGAAEVVLPTITDTDSDSYRTTVRGRINFQAKSDTELGVLHSYLRLQGENETGGDAAVGVDQAYLELGGLFAGYSESAWVYSTNGGLSGFGAHGEFDGRYGYQQRNMLQYHFEGGNWFAAVSVEDDGDTTTYMPDVVGRLGFVVGGITLFGVVGYDQDNGITNTALTSALPVGVSGLAGLPAAATAGAGSSEYGVKLGLNADVGAAGNVRVQGFYASGSTAYGANLGFLGQDWTPEWSILASYSHQFTPELTAYVNGQYFYDFYWAGTSTSTSIDAWSATVGASWSPVENFSATTEVRYTDIDNISTGVAAIDNPVNAVNDNWEFLFQLRRDF